MSRQNSPSLSNKLAIYLAGSIKKGHEPPSELFWTDEETSVLKDALKEYELAFLNPALRCDDLSVQASVFGRDLLMVYSSDFVLVDVRQRRGIGVGSEMMWAKVNRVPVIAYAPMDSHYRMSRASVLGVEVKDWVHPFVESLSDYIAGSLTDAAAWIQAYVTGKATKIKGPEHMQEAMALYKTTQYACDIPMQELVENSEALKHRVLRATGVKI
ncbi:MAG: hypothetical protein JSS60_04515 [Verrucomicrobia bacterium]|nr:hypothetical protein [Verrucomicrobiota bacterium]